MKILCFSADFRGCVVRQYSVLMPSFGLSGKGADVERKLEFTAEPWLLVFGASSVLHKQGRKSLKDLKMKTMFIHFSLGTLRNYCFAKVCSKSMTCFVWKQIMIDLMDYPGIISSKLLSFRKRHFFQQAFKVSLSASHPTEVGLLQAQNLEKL